jgi:fatty acid synthase subunit alpha, fungi type
VVLESSLLVIERGDSELYCSENVRFEDWWSKKYAPGLVKTR